MHNPLYAVARRRIVGIQQLIEWLLCQDIPYPNIRDALIRNQKEFNKQMAELVDARASATPATFAQLISTALAQVQDGLKPLETLQRACNHDAAFEIQAPLLRLIRACLTSKHRLILYYEWHPSPRTWTYPGQISKDYVWVGMPIVESQNPLVVPLAAHEIAHNIWNPKAPQIQTMLSNVTKTLGDVMMSSPFRSRILNELGIDDPANSLNQADLFLSPLALASYSASRQLQELFCDTFAICVFGTSYLNAYRYLLEPNAGPRSIEYPKNSDRIKFQSEAASEIGLTVPAGYEASFYEADDYAHDQKQLLLLDIADLTVARHWKEVSAFANLVARQAHIHCEDWIRVHRHELAFFKEGRPAIGSINLPTIIDAAWTRYNDLLNDTDLKAEELTKQNSHLFEITLKTLEVFELEQTITGTKL